MQSLMQVASLQQMRQNQQNQQERIELQRQEEARLLAAAQQKQLEDQRTRAARAAITPGLLRQEKRDQLYATIQDIKDPDVQASALGIFSEYEGKQSEINQRIATTGKNNADVQQMKLQQLANLGRGVRDVGKYQPAAIELAFRTAMLDDDTGITEQYYNQWKEAPEIGQPLIDFLITQGGENITLGTNEQRVTPTAGVLASGRTETSEPKVDFSMALPLYARDILHKDVKDLTAQDYAAAKNWYEKMNDQAARPGQPILIWTGQGPQWAVKPEAGQVPPGTTVPVQGPGGAVITPPATAEQRNQAGQYARVQPVLGAINELSLKINTGEGALAKIAGGVERAKAQANLNDDVAEYQAVVDSFAPLVARALGHTGVLTDKDVESAKAMFPKPGDSKTLRDRKMTRLTSLMEGAASASGGGVPPPAGAGGTGSTTTTTVPPTNEPAQDPDWLEFQRRRGQKK